MAEFCYQCTEVLYGTEHAPKNDFARGLLPPADIDKFAELCEGCGWTVVDREGRCLHLCCHQEDEHESEATE